MKEKRKAEKLPLKDHILYLFSYMVLFPFLFSLPWVMFIRNKLFLGSGEILALSNGYGMLWIIPSMILSAILIGYMICCDSKKIAFSISIKKIISNKLNFSIFIFCIFGILLSLFLSVSSGRAELTETDKQIAKYNIWGIKEQVFDIADVDKVELVFDSAYVSNGRYGENIISLSYCVYIDNVCLEFDSYNIEDLIIIDQIFIEKPHAISNEFYLDGWLASLNCNQEVKSSIEKILRK